LVTAGDRDTDAAGSASEAVLRNTAGDRDTETTGSVMALGRDTEAAGSTTAGDRDGFRHGCQSRHRGGGGRKKK
jgi:hypothetical protein